MSRVRLASALALACALVAGSAHAALTDSERAQAKGLVARGDTQDAGKVRALVGRPDLSEDEAALALGAGAAGTPFDAAHEAFFRALLFGPASQAARPALVAPVVRALLARAATLLDAHATDLPAWLATHRADAEELVRIYAFLDRQIANAGTPPAEGHDASAGLRDDALLRAVAGLRAHLERGAKWLGYADAVPAVVQPVRAQAAVAYIDLASGLASRREVADALSLRGARRAMFERTGTLVEDGGRGGDARTAALVSMWDSLPAAAGVELLFVDKRPAHGVVARGAIAQPRCVLGAQLVPIAGARLWPELIEASRPDTALAEIALEAARVATTRVLAKKRALAEAAASALARAESAGEAGHLALDLLARSLDRDPTGGGVVHATPATFVAHDLRLLLVDAPRALELALARSLVGRYEPLEQLALALTVAATSADGSTLAPSARLGVTNGDGTLAPVAVSAVHADASGLVDGFTLDGHRIELARSDGAIRGVKRDGRPPALSMLAHVRVPALAGESWTDGVTTFTRLSGTPRVAIKGEGRLTLVAPAGDGLDAISLPGPSGDASVEADLKPAGAGGIGLRGVSGKSRYAGVVLLIAPGSGPSNAGARAQLLAVDATNRGTEFAAAITLPEPGPDGFHVELSLRGHRITATVGKQAMRATLPDHLSGGSALVVAQGGGEVSVANLSVHEPGARAPRPASKPKSKPTAEKKP